MTAHLSPPPVLDRAGPDVVIPAQLLACFLLGLTALAVTRGDFGLRPTHHRDPAAPRHS
jgi:hypothetical protein